MLESDDYFATLPSEYMSRKSGKVSEVSCTESWDKQLWEKVDWITSMRKKWFSILSFISVYVTLEKGDSCEKSKSGSNHIRAGVVNKCLESHCLNS